MMKLRHIAPLLAAAALLASCTGLTAGKRISAAEKRAAAAEHRRAATRGWWVLPGKMEDLPPVVDTQGHNPLQMPGKTAATYVNPFPAGTFEHFAAQKEYPNIMQVYENPRLLELITATNAKIIICLPQQRGRLYVYGRVAMDWPVSTGVRGHETPTGVFRIIEKARDHHSSRYGKWLVNGKVVDHNADLTKEAPEGAEFSPSGMPNWNRLTWDGVGIHGGKVIAGRRLSHGCIRTPFATARRLYEFTLPGMPVYVSRTVEDYNRGGILKPIDVKYRPQDDTSDEPKKTAARTPVSQQQA